MPEENDDVNDVVQFFEREVCPLVDGECKDIINKYKKHHAPLILVNDIFDYLMQCKSEKCEINEGKIKLKLEEFIKRKQGAKKIG